MDFGWPNVKIDWKMANSHLLFLALSLKCQNYCKYITMTLYNTGHPEQIK